MTVDEIERIVILRPLLSEWDAEKTAIAAELERAEAARSRPARTKRLNDAKRRSRAFLNRLRRGAAPV